MGIGNLSKTKTGHSFKCAAQWVGASIVARREPQNRKMRCRSAPRGEFAAALVTDSLGSGKDRDAKLLSHPHGITRKLVRGFQLGDADVVALGDFAQRIAA